jgi:chromosome segregation ATPase
MPLTREDREEVVAIVKETMKSYDIDFAFLSEQFKKFKESPEGRLTVVEEAKVDDLARGQEGLRRDVTGLGSRLVAVETRLTGVETKVDELARNQAELREEIQSVENRLTGVETRLTMVESKVDDLARKMVTKDELKLLIDSINSKFEGVDGRFIGVDGRFVELDKRIELQNRLLLWVLGSILSLMILYSGLIIFLIGKL